MAFEDYHPRDRHISGRVHLASWLILAALVGILTVAVPVASSTNADSRMAAAGQIDCTA